MSKDHIKTQIETALPSDGLLETAVPGVKLFRTSTPIPCAPAVYDPCIVAIVSGQKEAIFDGAHVVYDASRYMCCPISMPLQAGTPQASPENPLMGVLISLDQRAMTELSIEIETAVGSLPSTRTAPSARGVKLAQWDAAFTDALSRLVDLTARPNDAAILGDARLRELYYAVFQGDAGIFARQAFGTQNAIPRAIAHISTHLDGQTSIDDMAARAGMSRAVFHRKFKQATAMSPTQFVKSLRLNNAAMKIAGGMTVNEAAFDVGYVSPSQFSREFKRAYGRSPREWGDAQHAPAGLV